MKYYTQIFYFSLKQLLANKSLPFTHESSKNRTLELQYKDCVFRSFDRQSYHIDFHKLILTVTQEVRNLILLIKQKKL